MLPMVIDPYQENIVCTLEDSWLISRELSRKLVQLAETLPFGIQIISGHRSVEEQEELIRDGMGAPLDRSTHVTCPATGADIWTLPHPTTVHKVMIGERARLTGLRWGGGSPIDPETNIPIDWNHLDLGRRP